MPFKKGCIPYNKGKTKKNYPQMANAGIKKGFKQTKKHKEKIRKANSNPTDATRKKKSDVQKGRNNSFYGKKHTKEEIKKQSGENHYNWRGGISSESYTTDWTESLRVAVRERDRYACRLCGKKQGDRTHSVHHIDYNKLNSNLDNLITLCVSCHIKTNFNRDYWTGYFTNLHKCHS